MGATARQAKVSDSLDLALAGVVLAAGSVAMLSPGHPTASPVGDALFKGAAVALVTMAAARARPWALLVLTGTSAIVASGWPSIAAWLALIATVGLVVREVGVERRARSQAVAAGVACLCLFHQGGDELRVSLLVGCVAVVPVLISGLCSSGPRARRLVGVAVGLVAGAVALAGVAVGVAGISAYPHLSAGAEGADAAIDAARAADERAALSNLRSSSVEFGRAGDALDQHWLRPVRSVPVIGQHLVALQGVADEGRTLASSPQIVKAVSEYRGLKYRSGRIDVDRVEALAEPVGMAVDLLRRSTARLDAIDRTWLLPPVAHRLDDFDERLVGAADDAQTAEDVLRIVPGLLGGDGARHYFVAFTNPAEARGLGGLLGNYGELEAIEGEVRMTRSGSTLDIEPPVPGVRVLTGPKEYLDRYGRYRPADYLRDATFSPHLPSVAEVISQLYPQAGGSEVDGVLVLDPYALAALLEFTGPIEVPGYPTTLTSENLADITLKQQYIDFADRNDVRKDLLVDATEIAFDRLLEGDLPSPGDLIDALGPMVRQRRLMFWSPIESEQSLFTSIHADGTMPAADGQDAFMLVHQNYGNSKIDAYLQRSISYEAVVDESTGRVESTVTITLRNDAPATGLPRYVIANHRGEPSGSNVMNLTAFTALTVRSATLDGEPVRLAGGTEGGLNAFDLRLAIPSKGTRRLVLDLVGGVDLRLSPYRLTLAPQGAVNPDRVAVTVDGQPAVLCGSGHATDRQHRISDEMVEVGAAGCRRLAP